MNTLLHSKWTQRSIFAVMCVIVAFVVSYILIRPADSMTDSEICSISEHIHNDECYVLHSAGETVLTCRNEGNMLAHVHDSFCYMDGILICPLEEKTHEHDESCYDASHVLCCGIAVHQHTEDCFSVLSEGESVQALACNTSAHRHSESCYASEMPSAAQPPDASAQPSVPETFDAQLVVLPEEDIMSLAEVSAEAIRLVYGDNISKITLSYKSGENWIEVTEDNCTELPADTGYKLKFWYSGISVEALRNDGGQMVFEGLPDWFLPAGTGLMYYNEEPVADIYAIENGILIVYHEEWLQSLTSQNLNGSFEASGACDWHKVPGNGETGTIPGLNFTFTFENNTAQKYGKIDIDKSEPELETYDGKYFLKYTITVTSLDEVEIPEVTVKDVFANASYINGYVGVSDGLTEPAQFLPSETDLKIQEGSMIWNIGTLQPGEERKLTYYAEIAEGYVNSLLSNPITNRAYVYSGTDTPYQKDDDASSFRPKTDVSLKKELTENLITNTGNGSVKYKITISASAENSYTMKNLTLKDWFPADLAKYLSGDPDNGGQITVTITDPEHPDSPETTVTVYANAAFEIPLELAPGKTLEIIYTVNVKNIFFSSNDVVDLINLSSVSNGDRTLASRSNTSTLEKNTWIRKMYGDMVSDDMEISMADCDGVYAYQDGVIAAEENPPASFPVEKGSHKYQVILNENGAWDMSSTAMKDRFGSKYLKYTGYVRVELYARSDKDKELAKSNEALLSELNEASPVKTIWFKVDGEDSFSFKPCDLGIEANEGNYTYLLTYYAHPENMENIGSVSITNHFSITGTVGTGNGTMDLPGIEVSISNIIQGGVKYDAEKISWYYEPSPVYVTDAAGNDDYKEANVLSEYSNGAIYWVIRLEGTIPAGTFSGTGRGTTLGGFYIEDRPNTTYLTFKRDAVVGVYVGSKFFDFTSYESFAQFLSDDNKLTELRGNPRNDKYFGSYFDTLYNGDKDDKDKVNPDYKWFCENSYLQGLLFPGGYQLKDDEALYIVLRTALTGALPTGNSSVRTYHNELNVNSGAGMVPADSADYVYYTKGSLHKESKGAYSYDINTGKFENVSNYGNNNDGWNIEQKVNKSLLTSSGVYAVWLLNVNWDGTMQGEADVSDFLPEGMELVYADINNVGGAIRSDPSKHPKTEYIEALNSDPAWHELTHDCKVPTSNSTNITETCITYYNSATREIRWHISNLTAGNGNNYDLYQINLRIVCKVTDPDLYLSGMAQVYENQAAIRNGDELSGMEVADVTITLELDKEIDKAVFDGTYEENGLLEGKVNKIPFMIEVNPFAEDVSDNDTLPALIDVFSKHLLFIEGSLKVTFADGTEYTGFIYTVDTDENGRQILTIRNLPDNTAMTIRYQARIDGKPDDEPVDISNTAYFAGYPPPGHGQVHDTKFKYSLTGDVFTDGDLTVTVRKVDADSHSKLLSGAEFGLYAVNDNGEPTGTPLRYGTTDSNGIVKFVNTDKNEETLHLNTVYCIKELKPPAGYQKDSMNCWYFIIVHGTTPDLSQYQNIDIWYESPNYDVTIENNKTLLSVEKHFLDENGNAVYPTSGTYRFGLFDAGNNLLETLTIVYSNGKPSYYIDGIERETPTFTRFEPTIVYYVYELDGGGNPISHDELGSMNGITYRVTYGSGSNEVSVVNNVITITNQENPIYLPASGGPGVMAYGAAGGMLAIGAVMLLVAKKRKK